MVENPLEPVSVNRRGLFLGAGVAALAATSLAGVTSADAAPRPGDGAAPAAAADRRDGSPITTTLASTPITGYTYRSVCMYDFEPFNPAAAKTWGGYGTYSATAATAMRATIEIPSGAVVRDVEFYVFNSTGTNTAAGAWLYVPGMGTIQSLGTVTIPSTSAISRSRLALASTAWGPYPSGSRLLVGGSTPADGSVQINGARVGMTRGGGAVGVLPAPRRVYDSRDTKKFKANETRLIALPTSVVATGTPGAFLNIHVVDGVSGAGLKVWAADTAEPTAFTINIPDGGVIANTIVVGISATRKIKIKSSRAAHVVVDLAATVA